jgi:hypothetical protein
MASKPIRPIRVEGNIAYIALTKGYEAVIDAADVPLVEGWNWYAQPGGRTVYAASKGAACGRRCRVFLHRLLLGEPLDVFVDHVNSDGLDNRRANLRLASASQNQHNKAMQNNNTSGFKGVTWKANKRQWVARISCGGKSKHLGYFDTPEAAHFAYASASAAIHGEFGRVS